MADPASAPDVTVLYDQLGVLLEALVDTLTPADLHDLGQILQTRAALRRQKDVDEAYQRVADMADAAEDDLNELMYRPRPLPVPREAPDRSLWPPCPPPRPFVPWTYEDLHYAAWKAAEGGESYDQAAGSILHWGRRSGLSGDEIADALAELDP